MSKPKPVTMTKKEAPTSLVVVAPTDADDDTKNNDNDTKNNDNDTKNNDNDTTTTDNNNSNNNNDKNVKKAASNKPTTGVVGSMQQFVQDVPQSTLSIPNYNQEMAAVERHLYYVGVICVSVYSTLLFYTLYIVPPAGPDDAVVLESTPLERSAAFLAFLALLLMIVLQYFPIFLLKKRDGYGRMSGVIFAGLAVVMVACVNNFMLYASPRSVVRLDPVTGGRVHLLRWAEWTPLAFTMTFLVEACDVPKPR